MDLNNLIKQTLAQRKVAPKHVRTEADEKAAEQFNTYIRSNTVTNIAQIPIGVTPSGRLRYERIDITSHEIPSKKQVKRMAGNKMQPSNRVFKTTGPGSSRSRTLDAIKAIAADETGAIVLEPQQARKLRKVQKPTTAPNSLSTGMRFNGGVE